MKYIYLLILSFFLISCLPKELRQKKRCNKKLERLTENCPDLLKVDTIEVKVPELVIEKEFVIKLDTVKIDSFIIQLDTIVKQKDKIRFVTDIIKQNYTLDTLVVDSLYNLSISIKNGVLSFNVKVKEQTIKVEDKIIVPIELSWYDKLLIYATKYWWLLLIAALIYIFIKFGIKLFL